MTFKLAWLYKRRIKIAECRNMYLHRNVMKILSISILLFVPSSTYLKAKSISIQRRVSCNCNAINVTKGYPRFKQLFAVDVGITN